jgi:two-component system, OmpR family, phosphate regulon sensor histidine kinase PhoR
VEKIRIMQTRFRNLPVWMLTALVILPVLVVAGVGMRMLLREQQRLALQAENAQTRLLEQTAERLRERLESVRRDLLTELTRLPADSLDEGLMDLQRRHPLVRNVFRVSEEGDLQLPSPGIYLDAETREFLQRYEVLFSKRMRWFAPEGEQPRSRIQKISPALRSEWRPWQWADRDALLFYVSRDDGQNVIGVEIEMVALYARMNVWMRDMSARGDDLLILDRRDRVLITTGERENRSLGLHTEMGALLPFARLGMITDFPVGEGYPNAYIYVAGMFGVLLLLCILGGTLGLTAWVNRSRKEAMQKTTFVSNVSHEFKTPLTTLRLYSELLLEGRVTDPEKQKLYLTTLRDESERLARLVHNVLDFSRLEMGRGRLHPERLRLNEAWDAVMARMRERFEGAGMEVELPEQPCWGFADPDAVAQILLNLFDNAIKYAAAGGVLRIEAARQGNMLQVRFQDKGPGMPKSETGKVFQAFHQVDASITRESGGTGLGLHISRRLAREMGGDLICEANEKGCTFIWTLPFAREENA